MCKASNTSECNNEHLVVDMLERALREEMQKAAKEKTESSRPWKPVHGPKNSPPPLRTPNLIPSKIPPNANGFYATHK